MHADDALPPREARDRRRRARVRRRHRPDDARGRPLRLQRAPAQGAGDRLARRVRAAARAGRARRRRPLRAALGGDGGRGARAARDVAPAGEHTVQFTRTVPEGAYRVLPRGEFSILETLHPRAAQRAEADLPREPVPVVAGDRRDPRGQAAQSAVRRLPRRRPAAAPGQQRPGRHARDARAPRRAPTTAAGTSSPRRSCRAPGERSGPLYVHAKIGIVDDEWLAIGSANLNEHSLFNDTEVDVVTCDPALARATRLRLWEEHLEQPADGDPATLVDTVWRPIASEQLERRAARSATDPSSGRAAGRQPPLPTAARPARLASGRRLAPRSDSRSRRPASSRRRSGCGSCRRSSSRRSCAPCRPSPRRSGTRTGT